MATRPRPDLAIARVVDIQDTRQFERVADSRGRMVWRPVPDSGEQRRCDRCGRPHEVWATVELVDGSRRVVGTGCAGARPGLADAATRARAAILEAEHQRAIGADLQRLLQEAPAADFVNDRVTRTAVMRCGDVDIPYKLTGTSEQEHTRSHRDLQGKARFAWARRRLQELHPEPPLTWKEAEAVQSAVYRTQKALRRQLGGV